MTHNKPLQNICVDKKCNDRSVRKNSAYVDFNDKKFDNVGFTKLNSYPPIAKHAISKNFVDHNIESAIFVENDRNENYFNKTKTNWIFQKMNKNHSSKRYKWINKWRIVVQRCLKMLDVNDR